MGVSRIFVALLALVALSYGQETAAQTENVHITYTPNPPLASTEQLECTVVINDDATTLDVDIPETFAKTVFQTIRKVAGVS